MKVLSVEDENQKQVESVSQTSQLAHSQICCNHGGASYLLPTG